MSARNQSLGAALLPQVNLLPPEVRAARSVRRVKGWLGISFVLSLLVVAGVYLLGTMEKSRAQDELDTARRETDALLAEQATYAEVPRVLQALARAENAAHLVEGAEIRWDEYLAAIEAIIGDRVAISTLAVTQVDEGQEPNPLDPEAIAVMTFSGIATSPIDGPAFADSLEALPGLEAVRTEVMTLTGEGELRWWEVRVTARVTTDALTVVRLADDAEDADEEEE